MENKLYVLVAEADDGYYGDPLASGFLFTEKQKMEIEKSAELEGKSLLDYLCDKHPTYDGFDVAFYKHCWVDVEFVKIKLFKAKGEHK